MLAVYPFDNYTDPAQYLAAITDIMTGARQLPTVGVPAPWTQADYVQFTGRAPIRLIPGYATGANWAKTADMGIVVSNAAPDPHPWSVQTSCGSHLSYLSITLPYFFIPIKILNASLTWHGTTALPSARSLCVL